jgi:hypothetical protein
MYTIHQIEQVAIEVFASVTDHEHGPSKLRMKAITELYGSMLAHKSKTVDEAVLDEGTAILVAHFLQRDRAAPAAGDRQHREILGIP